MAEAAEGRAASTSVNKGATRSRSNVILRDEHEVEVRLREELERLKRKVGIGFEVNVRWLPGTVKYKDGKQLLEEVLGDVIIIYAEDPAEATQLLPHGFAEWVLNQHTKKYRLLINKLIELFEQIQYDEKEKLIGAITKLIANSNEM
jgi:hypothetical protein